MISDAHTGLVAAPGATLAEVGTTGDNCDHIKTATLVKLPTDTRLRR